MALLAPWRPWRKSDAPDQKVIAEPCMSRGREPPAHDQVVEGRLDVGCPQRRRVAPGAVGGAVKRQKLPHPTGVGVDGARRQPAASRDHEKLLQQFHDGANFYRTSRHAVKRKSDLMRR